MAQALNIKSGRPQNDILKRCEGDMRIFNKAILGCMVASVSATAVAADLTLTLDDSSLVVRNISSLDLDAATGNIAVQGGSFDPASVPGLPVLDDNNFVCGDNTVKEDLLDGSGNAGSDGIKETCVGVGVADPSVYCDTANGMTFNESLNKCELPDEVPPGLTVAVNSSQLELGEETATVTFTFDDEIQNFSVGMVNVSNGVITGLTQQSATLSQEVWTATFTRSDNDAGGTATISVAANKFRDDAGNWNTESASAVITLVGSAPACDLRYKGVDVRSESAIFEWPSGTSQTPMYLSRNGVHSYPFTTGTNTKFNGQLGFVPFSNTATVEKDIWISECAGGMPVEGAPYNGVCEKKGKQTTLFWEQTGSTSWRCSLESSTKYFLNVRNHPGSCTVSSGCNAKVQHLITGSAN
ncbi:Ig-like domain-containing protein [uncultured Gilvimarinus sp.]|uniref:Ig-like domain-containing protein n=1 Tax=uncultured Gilvimarinus sp. TaxID=1689143 RepID=UPI0030DC3E59